MLEVKCLYRERRRSYVSATKPPARFVAQVQGQLALSGHAAVDSLLGHRDALEARLAGYHERADGVAAQAAGWHALVSLIHTELLLYVTHWANAMSLPASPSSLRRGKRRKIARITPEKTNQQRQ